MVTSIIHARACLYKFCITSNLTGVLKHVGETALSAVMTVEVHGHEGTGTAVVGRALLPYCKLHKIKN
jgi:hypothetical protein